jgi:spoIIIJ-associated protein
MSTSEENKASSAPEPVVEASGETVGEAKWTALRELERRFPGLDKASVSFVVVSEGERGLLGVGYEPAKVLARLAQRAPTEPPASEEPGTPAARLRELLETVCGGIGAPCAIAITEDEQRLYASLTGPDLGVVIGRRGHTIDAVQYLANAIVFRGHEEPRKEVVVDAAGYRDRRRSSLENVADRAASEALSIHGPVALEPMTAVERKIVHLHLAERGGIVTSSEGTEPNRRVVVAPASEQIGS